MPAIDSGVPDSTVPLPLWDFWLRFHELELCQEMRATFAFQGNRIEIWCRVENEKAFLRFREMLDPLRISNLIELHVAEGPSERAAPGEDDPPPSLWNNEELKHYFQEGPQLATASAGVSSNAGEVEPGIILKQRLIMFAEQTLNWNRKMQRYGEDLPGLAEAALDLSAVQDTRLRAKAICLLHAEAIDKYAEKLIRNMLIALPKASKKSKASPGSEADKKEKPSIRERAAAISRASQSVARRIFLFINPQDFGVPLSDLRDPDLLDSLKSLRNMLVAFKLECMQDGEYRRSQK